MSDADDDALLRQGVTELVALYNDAVARESLLRRIIRTLMIKSDMQHAHVMMSELTDHDSHWKLDIKLEGNCIAFEVKAAEKQSAIEFVNAEGTMNAAFNLEKSKYLLN